MAKKVPAKTRKARAYDVTLASMAATVAAGLLAQSKHEGDDDGLASASVEIARKIVDASGQKRAAKTIKT